MKRLRWAMIIFLPETTGVQSRPGPARRAGRCAVLIQIAWVGCACDVIAWNAVRMTRASLDKQPHDVAAMFDQVADRYDLTNDVLSLGQDRRWRRAVLSAVDPDPEILSSTSRPGPGPAACRSCSRARAWCRVTSRSGCSRSGSGPGRGCPSWPVTRPGCRSRTGRSTR